MTKHENFLSKLIYLDSDFISSSYEEIANVSPNTQFARTEGTKADGGIALLNAGIYSQETRTFNISSIEMLRQIYDRLRGYPAFQPGSFRNYEGTQTVWTEGQLTMGEWRPSKESEEEPYILFELKMKTGNCSLLVQPESFSSNIGGLLAVSQVLRRNIGIPVNILGRVLYFVEAIPSFVVCPYLIVESRV